MASLLHPRASKLWGASAEKRFVFIGTSPISFETLGGPSCDRYERARATRKLITFNVALQVGASRRGVGLKYITGSSLRKNEVNDAIFRDFLPHALTEGRYLPSLSTRVLDQCVGDLQYAANTQRRGVSSWQIIVTLA